LKLVADGKVAVIKVEERDMFAFGDKDADQKWASLYNIVSAYNLRDHS